MTLQIIPCIIKGTPAIQYSGELDEIFIDIIRRFGARTAGEALRQSIITVTIDYGGITKRIDAYNGRDMYIQIRTNPQWLTLFQNYIQMCTTVQTKVSLQEAIKISELDSPITIQLIISLKVLGGNIKLDFPITELIDAIIPTDITVGNDIRLDEVVAILHTALNDRHLENERNRRWVLYYGVGKVL